MKAQWLTWYGRIQTLKKKTSPSRQGTTHPFVPLAFSVYNFSEGQGIRLVLAWYINFSIKTTCHTFSEHISFVWRDMLLYSTSIFQLYGPHRTTVIAAEIQQASLKWDLEVQCISTSLTRHLKTSGTGLLSKVLKMLVERYVTNTIYRSNMLDNFSSFQNISYEIVNDRSVCVVIVSTFASRNLY